MGCPVPNSKNQAQQYAVCGTALENTVQKWMSLPQSSRRRLSSPPNWTRYFLGTRIHLTPSTLLPHPAQHRTHIRKTTACNRRTILFSFGYNICFWKSSQKCQVVVVISVLGHLVVTSHLRMRSPARGGLCGRCL